MTPIKIASPLRTDAPSESALASESLSTIENPSGGDTTAVIVCGLGRFGVRVVECLREQDPAVSITVVTNTVTRADRLRRVEALGASIVLGDFRFAETRGEAGIAQATAIIFCSSSDTDSLAAAMDARGEAPRLRILMRLDEGRIAHRLMTDFGIDLALSPPALAAREFSRAALELRPNNSGSEPLSEKEKRSCRRARTPLHQRLRLPPSYDTRRPLLLLALLLIVLFGVGVEVFQHTLRIPLIDAIYFTASIITTVGFGDYNLQKEGPILKLFGTLLMFGGVMLVALLTSFVTNFFLSGAAAQLRTVRMAERAHDHVIVCGLGTVGFEVVRNLVERRTPLVVIDNSPDSNSVRLMEGRVAIILGDASSEDALLRAGVLRARAVIACLSDDAKNLEIGLTAQTLAQERNSHRPLRLVLRCFDSELARRIHAASSDYTLLSSAEIAAPVFARAALAPPGTTIR